MNHDLRLLHLLPAAVLVTQEGAIRFANAASMELLEAPSIDSLIGRTGRITIGTATRGAPARAEIHDVFGHPHQVMVEPDDENGRFETGTMVMLVRRDGHAFRAILYGDHPMLRLD